MILQMIALIIMLVLEDEACVCVLQHIFKRV